MFSSYAKSAGIASSKSSRDFRLMAREEKRPRRQESDAALSFGVQAALVVAGVPVPADCIFSIA